MLAHIDIKVVEVLDCNSELLKSFNLARLIPLIKNFENLLDQLKGRFDTIELLHMTR